jgi:TonB family protein
VRLTIGLLTLVPVFAQPSPDAASLLAREASELKRYHSYQLTQEMTMDMKMPGMAMPATTSTIVTQAVNPGKVRMEMKTAGMDAMQMISDGKDVWMYMPLFKQYTKMPADGTEDMQSMMGMGMTAMPDITKTGADAKVVRSEMVQVDGQQHDCWVIEIQTHTLPGAQAGAEMGDSVFTSWVDKALGIQLKMSTSGKSKASASAPAIDMRMVTTMRSMKFNSDLPDSLFVFTPPPDAKESKELFPGMGAITGGAPAATEKTPPKPQPGEPEAFVPMLNPIERIEPDYPTQARSQGVQGMVDLLVTIDYTGAVVNAEPLSGREILRPAAVEAVKKWKFRPVFRDGHPVSAYTQAYVNFFLNSGKTEASDLDVSGQMQSAQRVREISDHFPRSPEQVLADSEEQIRGEDGIERFYALTNLPKQALDAGALEKASSYAIELLKLANDHKGDWNYGNAVYDANMVLGLVALRQDNVAGARSYLLESGKTSGSPQLDSFGPDLTLARELLGKGERDAVLEFLGLLKGFWKLGADQLDVIAAEVRKGGTF